MEESRLSNQLVIVMAIKLVIGFMAAFTSVMLWSKTRDGAWLSMVLGVVFLYLETLLEILDSFGFIIYKSFNFGEIEILPLLFNVLPFLFFTLGLVIFLLRIRRF